MTARHTDSLEVLAERLHGLERTLAEHAARVVSVAAERDERYMAQFAASEKAVANALVAAKELTAQAFASSEKAIAESKVAQADVNAKSNEFRGQLKDQNETMIPRPEAAALFRSLEEKVEELRKAIATIREQATSYPSRNEVTTIVSGLSKDITELREARSASLGKGLGISASWAFAVAVIGLLMALVNLSGIFRPAAAPVYAPSPPGTLLPTAPSVTPTGR